MTSHDVSCWVVLEVIVNQSHDDLLLESLDIAVEEALYRSDKNPQPPLALYTGQIGMPLDLIPLTETARFSSLLYFQLKLPIIHLEINIMRQENTYHSYKSRFLSVHFSGFSASNQGAR